MSGDLLTEREKQVLEAVIRTYVETAEPAASRTVAKRFQFSVSPATVRNTMADLEEKGYLYHPHASAGRIPTDRAYRFYVDTLMRPVRLSAKEQRRLRKELAEPEGATALDSWVRRAVQVIGLLTGELGLAIAPRLADAVLESLELVSVSRDKLLLVLRLQSGGVRTVYIDLPGSVAPETLVSVAMILNERLSGATLREIRRTLPERLRDAAPPGDEKVAEVLDTFTDSAEEILEWHETQGDEVHLGRASVLAQQPEFATESQLKNLIELTEQRDLLASVLSSRDRDSTVQITIGSEHGHPKLSGFALITAEYQFGSLSGVIGVMGPTRMPYERVAAVVEYTSSLVSELAAS
ncbi:MAG TPA: heat-inducible transcriptional repressor HrcA [Longimicrobiales bacterium]